MRFRPLTAISFVFLAAFVVLVGCGGQNGDVCQVPGDCAAGYVCTCKLGGGVDARGVCRVSDNLMCTTTTTDAGSDAASASDANVDAFSAPDVGTSDAGSDGGSDAGSSSDGGSDAASTTDGGADANADAG